MAKTEMFKVVIKLADRATDFDLAGNFKKADKVDRFLEILAGKKIKTRSKNATH